VQIGSGFDIDPCRLSDSDAACVRWRKWRLRKACCRLGFVANTLTALTHAMPKSKVAR
jgi:hypothetical protein